MLAQIGYYQRLAAAWTSLEVRNSAPRCNPLSQGTPISPTLTCGRKSRSFSFSISPVGQRIAMLADGDFRFHRKPHAQRRRHLLTSVNGDLDRYALDDLREVARCVVGCDRRKAHAGCWSEAIDTAVNHDARKAVDLDPHAFARPHVGDLVFLEVGDNIG